MPDLHHRARPCTSKNAKFTRVISGPFSGRHADFDDDENGRRMDPVLVIKEVQAAGFEFVDYTGIILDHCPQCRGFWLDGAELESINEEIRRLNETASEIHDPPWLFLVRLMSSLTR